MNEPQVGHGFDMRTFSRVIANIASAIVYFVMTFSGIAGSVISAKNGHADFGLGYFAVTCVYGLLHSLLLLEYWGTDEKNKKP